MSIKTPPNQVTTERQNGQRPRVQIISNDKGRTKQSMQAECDINNIMKKFQKTGAVAHVNQHGANYGYATSADFLDAMTTVTKGQEMFDALPSSIRNRFANSPANFLNFVQDPENKEEGQKLGLWPKDPPEVKDTLTARQTTTADGPGSETDKQKTETQAKKE